MPLHPTNYHNDVSPTSVPDLVGSVLRGYQAGRIPFQMKKEAQEQEMGAANLKEKMLKNMFTERFGEQERTSKLALQEAQAKHYADQAAGRNFAPSGLGKLIQERDDLMEQDPNSPLLAEYDRAIKATGSKNYAPSALGKLMGELQQVEDGYLPGSNGTVKIPPDKQKQFINKYLLQAQKQTTDSGTRTTSLRGQNLLKSIDASKIDDLTRYSGLSGAIKLKAAQAEDLTGNASDEYLKHLEAKQAAQLEAKELRQFFGDSITPSAADAIYQMVNATSLTRSPEAAKRMIQKSRDTIKKQIDTFTNALNDPNAYTSGNNAENMMSSALKKGAPNSDLSSLSDEELDARIAELQNGK